MIEFLANWLAFTPVFAVPLLLATLGLIVNERAGVINLGAEGMMLCGALAGVACFVEFGESTAVGMIGAGIAGLAIAALFAFVVVVLRADQVVTGITIVFFGIGLTGLIGLRWNDTAIAGFQKLDLGFLSDIPFFGKVLFAQDAMVYLTVPIVFGVWWFLFRTRAGLNLRAVGENPQAADAAGIAVDFYRFAAVAAGGALCGLAGGYLALAAAKIWVNEMTHGRGWIAIALVIFARWMPGRAVFGAILFGGIEALIPRIFAAGWPVPQYFLQMTPFLATLGVLVWVGVAGKRRSAAPGALGLPYVREDRW